ncbi:MAG: type III pantothenate kinase [Motiliproteus sp.]|jgi:type III pantothenate kinase
MLDIDIGNTRLKWRLRAEQEGAQEEQRGFIDTAALSDTLLRQSWGGLAWPQRVRFVSVASMEIEHLLLSYCRKQWSLTAEKALSQAAQAGVTNSYANFETMGADRWLAMLAGFQRAPGGCCVVDCGSAVTVDYVDATGLHLGGYIAPGLRLMRRGLLSNTRQIHLPLDAQGRFDTRPGKSTEEAVGQGIELMLAALAQRVVRDMPTLLGAQATLLVTGGDAARFLEAAGAGEHCADLVLDGLGWALTVRGSASKEAD